MTCYRHFNEEKTRLEAEWHNINRQVNAMKNQYMELRKRIDSLFVCSLFYFYRLQNALVNFFDVNSRLTRNLLKQTCVVPRAT